LAQKSWDPDLILWTKSNILSSFFGVTFQHSATTWRRCQKTFFFTADKEAE
jgi:hypothetical protein